jgi:hypothetical protein
VKKSLFISALVLFFPLFVFAQEFVPIAEITGLTDSETVGQGGGDLSVFFNNLYRFLIGFAAVAAVVMIIWGGIEYATTDNIGKKSAGRTRITQAIFGLILVLLPVLVFSIINPEILNLSVPFQKIDLPDRSNFGPGGGSPTSAPVQEISGCTQTAGPVAGSFYVTCTALTETEANNSSQNWLDSNCSGNHGRPFDAEGADSQQTYDDQGRVGTTFTSYTSTAYCSPEVIAEAVWTFQGLSFKILSYLSEVSFVNACTGSWKIIGDESDFDGLPTGEEFECPTEDPDFETLLRDNGTGGRRPICTNVQIFCAPINP